MSNMNKVAVWPLQAGVRGFNQAGGPIELQPGVKGWMELEDARRAQEEGTVQIMVGLSTRDLKSPRYQTAQSKPESKSAKPIAKKKAYARRDIQAEDAQE